MLRSRYGDVWVDVTGAIQWILLSYCEPDDDAASTAAIEQYLDWVEAGDIRPSRRVRFARAGLSVDEARTGRYSDRAVDMLIAYREPPELRVRIKTAFERVEQLRLEWGLTGDPDLD